MIEINGENILSEEVIAEKLGSKAAADVFGTEKMKWDLSNWKTHFTRKQAIYWEVARLADEQGMSTDEVQQGLIDGYFLLEIDFDKNSVLADLPHYIDYQGIYVTMLA